MTLRKWYQLVTLILALVITDQFFKIGVRYLAPEKKSIRPSVSVGYEAKPGWVERTREMPFDQATKNLFLSQQGILTSLILILVLVLFQKNLHSTFMIRDYMPYSFISAGILSSWLDHIGTWEPRSLQIRWIHIQSPLRLELSASEIYLFLGLLLFLWGLRQNKLAVQPTI